MLTLLCIRHGQACGDPHRSCTPPVEGFLTELGRIQAARMAQVLARTPIDRVYASPLGRAVETAQHLCQQREMAINILPWLIEWRPATQLGDCDEAEYEQIQRRAERIRPECAWKTPAGEGTLQMAHRVIVGFVELMQSLGIEPAHGGYRMEGREKPITVALVAHGGSLGRLASFLLGVPLAPYSPIAMDCGAFVRFDFVRRVDVWYPNLTVSLPENPQ